jgi:acetyl esterase/lipase
MGRFGEFLSVVSVSRKSQKANTEPHAVPETKVAFGAHPQQYVLVLPAAKSAPPRDSVVYFVHGGGWNFGNPSYYLFVGRFLAQLGYPTILGGYRLVPGSRFPAQLEDVSDGLRAGMGSLAESGLSVRRIILGGHSAGAQLAGLLAYDGSVMQAERSLFRGFLSISGPLDFSLCRQGRIRKLLDAYVGRLPDPGVADPIRYANPDAPISVLCVHGADDPLVDPENSASLARKVNRGPIQRARVLVLPETYHSDTLNLFLDESEDSRALEDWLASVDES